MNEHEKINYFEYAAKDLEATKAFFASTFGWAYTDYGPEYVEVSSGAGLVGGFYKADLCSRSEQSGSLIIFYSNDLEATQANIESAGGEITRPTFEFPGGKRFHFTEPSGNEFAVWTTTAK